MGRIVGAVGAWTIPLLLAGMLGYALLRRVKVYEAFVEGAKEGFDVGVKIIPYLVAILVAVGMFRASGALHALGTLLHPVLSALGIPVDVLPMAIVRPLSGGASLGIVGQVLKADGPNSMAGRMVSVMAGSTETTFYVLAVYFGAIGIKKVRHTLPAALLADIAGMAAAILMVRLMF